MKLIDWYKEQCAQGVISYDIRQIEVTKHFDKLINDLITETSNRKSIFSIIKKKQTIRGIYLWGKVGTGKTTLMDAFFNCLPFDKKTRMHFHHFMSMVHDELKLHQGKKNPLRAVADDIAGKNIIICFDEFTVSDITDAMLLGGLFEALFSRGVCLVATSNIPPDDLYHNGLQRERFLPAIERIKQHTAVLHIPSEIDYRLKHPHDARTFFTPLNARTAQNMQKTFELYSKNSTVSDQPISIQGRTIPVIAKADTAIWFDFKTICSVPRSQKDYLEIAERYKIVFVSNITVISPDEKDTICLFVTLVDVFYDARIRLIISAAEPISDLYQKGFMSLEYARTRSRLLEMQTTPYFDIED